MKKQITTLAAAASMVIGMALPALGAGPPAGAGEGGQPDGIVCQQAGISTLQSLGLLSAVAKDGVEVVELGQVVDFRTVLSLHRTNPDLFQTGGVSVVVPGIGIVAATWCDGIG